MGRHVITLSSESIQSYRDGMTVKDLAKRLCLAPHTVIRALKRQNVEVRRPSRRRNETRHKEVILLREKGKTFQEIGDILGISRQRAEQIAAWENQVG